ncbi:MAG: beta-ketoacyl-[Clostridia bacterium]|nr:beta-ketoacyl-[acyl-carrier-protein] synthase family protein [Clostridia bacterium]
MKRRVVITAYSVINDMGKNRKEVEEGIFSGSCGLSRQKFTYADGDTEGVFGMVHDLTEVHPFFEQHHLPYDRCSQLALMAADDCLAESGLDIAKEDPFRLGVSIGTSLGGMRSGDEFHKQWIHEGLEAADAAWLKQYPIHAVADVVAMNSGFRGCRNIISTACSASANSLGFAYDMIMNGSHDAILAGGVDPMSRFSFSGFTALKAIDHEFCRPYSASTGINLAEGAAFFLMEDEAHARARGATIIAEFKGYGITADAYHPTAPDPSGNGALRAMTNALRLSGVPAEDISYVNGHGTGTHANDPAESNAVMACFGSRIKDVPLSSTKGATGHCLGAAGSVECAISLMALQKNMAPPTIRFDEAKYGGKEIDYVPNKAREHRMDVVMSNSFAFGGNNCAIVVSRPDYVSREETAKREPVVITGIGCVGTGGLNAQELFETYAACRRRVGNPAFSTDECRAKDIMVSDEPDWKKLIPLKFLRRTDEVIRLTMASGREALNSAHLTVTRQNMDRIGVIYGTGAGPIETIESINRAGETEGLAAVNPSSFPNTVLNQAPGNFSIAYMLKGPTSTVSSSTVSLMQAFNYACELLENDHADAIVVIGSDECNYPLFAGYDKCGMLSKSLLPPLAKGADGFLLAEGSTAFVLEKQSCARARGAAILATVLGNATCSDNCDLITIDPSGEALRHCVKTALDQAGMEAPDLYVSAASGTPEADRAEETLITSLPETTLVSVPQAMTGTPLGASSGYGILNALYSFEKGEVTGMPEGDYTLSETVADRMTVGKNRAAEIRTACISAVGFGGTCACTILGKGDCL